MGVFRYLFLGRLRLDAVMVTRRALARPPVAYAPKLHLNEPFFNSCAWRTASKSSGASIQSAKLINPAGVLACKLPPALPRYRT